VKTTIWQRIINRPAARAASWQAAADHAAEAAQRLAETRAQIATDRTEFLSEIVALSFEFGRLQGRAEVMRQQITKLTAEAAAKTACGGAS
jgi:flagellar biosynthesis/type III secretory pathway protein FliH